MFSATDHRHMARALQLAERGLFTTAPNPRVGCVIVKGDSVLAEGWHERAGEAHAERMALDAAGSAARGATAYVSLEPCSHHGRTPPCADALIAAGVSRVVAAMTDPNPRVAGQGLQRLAAAGISTASGLLENEAAELNLGFISRMRRARPWLRLKAAASLDGRTALASGESKWITGAAARHDGHLWRARACAILTGVGTVKSDDPELNVRGVASQRQPWRVVIDSRLETPPTARILSNGKTLLVGAEENDASAARAAQLRARGAEVIFLPAANGRVDLPALASELARREANEVHVEAGSGINGALLAAGLVDEIILYLAPSLIGSQGRGIFDLPTALSSLEMRHRLTIHDLRSLGNDLRITARLAQSDA